jgi:hypothetical protein
VNVVLVVLVVLLGLVVLLEVSLRLLFGFGNPPIYLADEKIGYLLAPNQRTKRFGNRIAINQYSMRSPSIDVTRPSSTLRVLLLGDSVANGAWWTDQERTISALIATQREFLVHPGAIFEQVEVLNASANSWGPRNELAYLQRFGTFNAQAVVLLINTDDLFATAPTSVQVGRDRNYPNRKPPCAIAEVLSRYVLPTPSIPDIADVNAAVGVSAASPEEDRVGSNFEAIRQIQSLTQTANAQFLLAMTPLRRELGGNSRDYEQTTRQRLVRFTQEQKIAYLDFLSVFDNTEMPESLYRDHIHLSPCGNQKVSEAIARSLQQLLQLSATPTPTTDATSHN